MQERMKSKRHVRKAIEVVNALTKAIMRIPLTKKPDPKKPATRQAEVEYKRPQYDRTFGKSDVLKAAELIKSVTEVLKAMTAGSSASTGSNLMHSVADGAKKKKEDDERFRRLKTNNPGFRRQFSGR